MAHKGFLNLPPEVRSIIYRQILPERPTVCWRASTQRFGKSGPSTLQAAIFWPRCSGTDYRSACYDALKQCGRMIRTCRIVRAELGNMMYRSLDIKLSRLDAMQQVQESISATTMSLVEKLRIPFRCLTFNEKEEKRLFAMVLANFTGLKTLVCTMDYDDDKADAEEKGTGWKPHALRKLLFILEHSPPSLSRVFVRALNVYGQTDVRFVGKSDQVADNEVELDVKAEYQKWLDVRSENVRIGKAAKEALANIDWPG